MRQIVQLNRPIVQDTDNAGNVWPTSAGISGRADASAWCGGRKSVLWDLSQSIGFLLVTAAPIETQCAAGNKTRLTKGDLLILNLSGEPRVTFVLEDLAAKDASPATHDATAIRALHGAIQPANAHMPTGPFAQIPSWSMAVARLDEHEFSRTATLARLVASESEVLTLNAPKASNTQPARLLANLEAALFEALAGALWLRDPLSLPQLAGCGDKRLARALAAMAAAPAKPWRIDSMAREAAMSRTAFATQFKKIVGKTPLDYLTGLRLQWAATLLENAPAQSIDSIARDVGYADESALRRAYLRATGAPLKRRN